MDNSICGIVVTYHPDADVLKNIAALGRQVQHVVVVDNGSNPEGLLSLRSTAATLDFELIENGDNLGIATALNIGVRRAEALGAKWVFLMDQDSFCTEGCVATMLKTFAPPLGILNPRYIDSRSGQVLEPLMGADGHVQAAITSGSLSPISIFQHAGYFADEMFIDGVDYEYSFRVRSLGYTIDSCPEAVILHSPGTPTFHSLFGSKPFHASNYSPVRRYYQERNKIWVTRRYWRKFLPFMLVQFKISLKDMIKIALVEQNRAEKLRHFFRGILDGLRGRMGKYQPKT